MDLSGKFWDNRYLNNDTGWDLGEISEPLKKYIDQLPNKSIRILIPGGGNSHEAIYLFLNGFKNVFVVDFSITALNSIKQRVPEFPASQLIHANFFSINKRFDLVIEQTFFCAINPSLRDKYAAKMHELLVENGKLVGVLFEAPLNDTHPPFGGNKQEYITYFSGYFQIKKMESCYNSMTSRKNKELFIHLIKK